MNIKNVKKEYKEQKISKGNFIEKMHEFHKVLFDFSENLKHTEIAKIEILDNKTETNFFFLCPDIHTDLIKNNS